MGNTTGSAVSVEGVILPVKSQVKPLGTSPVTNTQVPVIRPAAKKKATTTRKPMTLIIGDAESTSDTSVKEQTITLSPKVTRGKGKVGVVTTGKGRTADDKSNTQPSVTQGMGVTRKVSR